MLYLAVTRLQLDVHCIKIGRSDTFSESYLYPKGRYALLQVWP